MWPGECWATSTPSQQLTRPLPPHLSPQEDGKECLPLTCLSVNPDPKKIPSNQRAVPTEVLRDLGRGVGTGTTCPELPPLILPRPHPRNAAEVQDGSQYSVLLIITDGVISDMAQTKEAIVNVSCVGAPGAWGGGAFPLL